MKSNFVNVKNDGTIMQSHYHVYTAFKLISMAGKVVCNILYNLWLLVNV